MSFKRQGFTLVELIISIAILALISVSTIFSLRRTREKDELNTAGRLLTADIRNIQARALAGRNVLTCDTVSGRRVCEPENTTPSVCTGACESAPPSHFGIWFTSDEDGYILFADVLTEDWRYDGPAEFLLLRNLNPLGGRKVVVSDIKTEFGPLETGHVAVGRQNGLVRIDACNDPGQPVCAPTEPKILQITLRHVMSDETLVVEINAVTGRVSIQ